RWHKSDCSQPSIIVDDGVPRCNSCDSSSSVLVAQLIAQNQAKGGHIHLPVATPLGEANLWWPPCVPYHSPQASTRLGSVPSEDWRETTRIFNTDSERSSVSPIYPSSLDSSHFRLIYLTESDATSPIHIQLEVYAVNDHPEYETVSYVWGGEEGDSTPRRPVYVGSFWDVILVTKNCSAVLHYLRPQKGCRFIWLDAICINQDDNIEKPAQISRMGSVYANCERVVAYFGEDLVSRPPGRVFRPRIDFQRPTFGTDGINPDDEKTNVEFLLSCAKSAGFSQEQLFERRYLTRIWIVQELLLSKKAIFPLGDFDILCDRKESMHLVLRTNRELLLKSAIDGKSLSHLLKATSHCHASDPRDRVYGLLGLFEPRDISRKLIPSYAISWRDCWVGTAAYSLLVEGNLVLLAHAVGNNRPKYLPSWVPDI
ncbi:heterokaryon incompatibility protein-domain-containing protein, partial [Diaporthe sp. PMI_573]